MLPLFILPLYWAALHCAAQAQILSANSSGVSLADTKATSASPTLSLCPTLTVNPTYTPATPLPSDYLWGCPPHQLCHPKRTAADGDCNFAPGPPADTYFCSPDECISSPPIFPPVSLNEPGKYIVSPGYFYLNPTQFGLDYGIYAFPDISGYSWNAQGSMLDGLLDRRQPGQCQPNVELPSSLNISQACLMACNIVWTAMECGTRCSFDQAFGKLCANCLHLSLQPNPILSSIPPVGTKILSCIASNPILTSLLPGPTSQPTSSESTSSASTSSVRTFSRRPSSQPATEPTSTGQNSTGETSTRSSTAQQTSTQQTSSQPISTQSTQQTPAQSSARSTSQNSSVPASQQKTSTDSRNNDSGSTTLASPGKVTTELVTFTSPGTTIVEGGTTQTIPPTTATISGSVTTRPATTIVEEVTTRTIPPVIVTIQESVTTDETRPTISLTSPEDIGSLIIVDSNGPTVIQETVTISESSTTITEVDEVISGLAVSELKTIPSNSRGVITVVEPLSGPLIAGVTTTISVDSGVITAVAVTLPSSGASSIGAVGSEILNSFSTLQPNATSSGSIGSVLPSSGESGTDIGNPAGTAPGIGGTSASVSTSASSSVTPSMGAGNKITRPALINRFIILGVIWVLV